MWTAAHADLESHLKRLQNKTEGHSLRNIDFIYMINLDQRPEKWQMSVDQLRPYGIYPCRFSAVNGWELGLETINDVGLKFSPEMEAGGMATCYHLNGNYEPSHEPLQNYGQTYFCHCLSRGAIGIALSHLSILQDAWDCGYEAIWVMEDDIEVIRDPRILSDLIDKLDEAVGRENWDILFTDEDIRDAEGRHKSCFWGAKRPDFARAFAKANDYAQRVDVSPDFRRIGARWGHTLSFCAGAVSASFCSS